MTVSVPQWGRIPEALRALPRWCIAGPDKAPYYLPNAGAAITRASVTDSRTWMTFTSACSIAFSSGQGIGYVCHADDPFTCIDLDNKGVDEYPDEPEKWTTPEQIARAWSIVREFESYTERSRSGKGLHLWVGGKIGQGARRENIEIYSQQRFIICTGDVVVDMPITAGQPLLDKLLEQVRSAQGGRRVELVEQEDGAEDKDVLDTAINASNSDKFNKLCAGRWDDEFPSQSEADLALMSMFTFYSPSNAQCKRLFRMTALGKREKAVRDDRYLNLTLQTIRSRQARESAMDDIARKQSMELIARLQANHIPSTPAAQPAPQQPAIGGVMGNAPPAAPPPIPPAPPQIEDDGDLYPEKGLSWPPGVAGRVARFIYHSSPRPVREVSIVATLGLLAGVCGKAYTIPQSGLNMYIVLVARSAIGKEAMHTGLSHILKFALESRPGALGFIDFNDYVSGPALVKKCAETQSFVNVAGEWGRKLKRLSAAETGNDSSMQSLRTAMTNLYQKSGPSSIVGGLSYSSKENNVASVSGVAYSMIGETTPNTFYEALTEDMMADGFLSRFTIIEYAGDRPATNTRQVLEIEADLKETLGNLFNNAIGLNQNNMHVGVLRTPEAGVMIDAFDAECDKEIRSTDEESWRQMWNRAHLKVLRMAALLACADNCIQPCITVEQMDWALSVVRADIAMMAGKLRSGDIGTDDTSRERKVMSIAREYLSKPPSPTYGIPDGMRESGIIPRKYLQLRVQRLASFYTHRLGTIGSLDSLLRNLCDSGYFIEISKDKLVESYAFHGKCYRVVDTGGVRK